MPIKIPSAAVINKIKQQKQEQQREASRVLHAPSPSSQIPPGYYDDEAKRPSPERWPLIELDYR